MTSDDRRKQLIDLGPEVLADALLQLAFHSKTAQTRIEQLLATPEEHVRRFKSKISGLKRRKRFIGWRESAGFAVELQMLLQGLREGVDDPITGMRLVARFYEADDTIFHMCDDSSGMIGDVFREDAQELFAAYASRCDDKRAVADLILRLMEDDGFGVRDSLVDVAAEFLPEEVVRSMIATFQERADQDSDGYGKRHHLHLIESLARQIKDPALYEKTRRAYWDELPVAAMIDIAQVYFESGDVETAHAWIKKYPEDETFRAYDRDRLLKKVYREQGDSEKLADLLLQNFESDASIDTLQALLDVIGQDKKDEVIAEAVTRMRNSEDFRISDAEFLIEVGRIDEAERYLLERAGQFNGNLYDSMLSLAKVVEPLNLHLATTLIYRSLLLSILERGYIKAYPHGVRYLKKLDKLAPAVPDWKGFDDHDAFKGQITLNHGRKSSFWSKYGAKK